MNKYLYILLLIACSAGMVAQENIAPQAREIELDITGDFPAGERIDPEVVSLNGKDVREYKFIHKCFRACHKINFIVIDLSLVLQL